MHTLYVLFFFDRFMMVIHHSPLVGFFKLRPSTMQAITSPIHGLFGFRMSPKPDGCDDEKRCFPAGFP